MSFISSIRQRASDIAKNVKSTVASFVYEHDPNPSLYVVETLNEMIDIVTNSKNKGEIYNKAKSILKGMFKCFNDYKYCDHIPDLNYLNKKTTQTHVLDAMHAYHDWEVSHKSLPSHTCLPLGNLLEHFCGYDNLSNSTERDKLSYVVDIGRQIVKILSKQTSFQRFCQNIEPHQYHEGQHYKDSDMRRFKVAFLMHNENVESFMNALIVDNGDYRPDDIYKRPIKCWLSVFFSAETARVLGDRPQLKLPLNQFSVYPERIAELAFLPQIPTVVPEDYPRVVEEITTLVRSMQLTDVPECGICYNNFTNVTLKRDDLGIQCMNSTCHAEHPFCQGCAKKLDKCPSCRGPLEHRKNLIPGFLEKLKKIKQNLDEVSKEYAQFPLHMCPRTLDGPYPQFMLLACKHLKEIRHIDPTKIERKVTELIENLENIQEKTGIEVKRERNRSRSPSRGGARKRTTRVSRKQRKQRKQCKSRKQRK
jgi:hypothetical protein